MAECSQSPLDTPSSLGRGGPQPLPPSRTAARGPRGRPGAELAPGSQPQRPLLSGQPEGPAPGHSPATQGAPAGRGAGGRAAPKICTQLPPAQHTHPDVEAKTPTLARPTQAPASQGHASTPAGTCPGCPGALLDPQYLSPLTPPLSQALQSGDPEGSPHPQAGEPGRCQQYQLQPLSPN